MSDAVDRYLDELAEELGVGAEAWRLLSESEAHLRESQDELQRRGMSPDAAAHRALSMFGDARVVAAAHERTPRQWAVAVTSALWLYGSLGLIVIGVSGLLIWLALTLWGAGFVAGDVNGVTYTTERCAQFISFVPGTSCETAVALHHSSELIETRLVLGLLGALLLGAWAAVPRLRRAQRTLPWRVRGFMMGGMSGLFLLAAAGLGGFGTLWSIGPALHGDPLLGVGGYFSDGISAAIAALGLALVLARQVRSRRAAAVRSS